MWSSFKSSDRAFMNRMTSFSSKLPLLSLSILLKSSAMSFKFLLKSSEQFKSNFHLTKIFFIFFRNFRCHRLYCHVSIFYYIFNFLTKKNYLKQVFIVKHQTVYTFVLSLTDSSVLIKLLKGFCTVVSSDKEFSLNKTESMTIIVMSLNYAKSLLFCSKQK